MLKRFIILFLIFASNTIYANPERTLAIIKPDAVLAHHIGDIVSHYETSGFRIVALKMVQITQEQAEKFYAIHASKPFFKDLVKFMSSSPSVAIALEGDNAVQKNRNLIGDLDKEESLRGKFGTSKTKNAIHGSDSVENALQEIHFFFPDL